MQVARSRMAETTTNTLREASHLASRAGTGQDPNIQLSEIRISWRPLAILVGPASAWKGISTILAEALRRLKLCLTV